MKRSDIQRYQKKLLASLPRRKDLRKELLYKFQISLKMLMEENDSPSYDDLLAAFGPPDEMARTLLQMSGVSSPPSTKKRILAIAASCALVLCIGAGLFFLYNGSEVGVVCPGAVDSPTAINEDAYFIVNDPFTHSDSHWRQSQGMNYAVEIHNTGDLPVDITIRYAIGQPAHTFSVPPGSTETFVTEKTTLGNHRVSFVTEDGNLSGTVRVLVFQDPF